MWKSRQAATVKLHDVFLLEMVQRKALPNIRLLASEPAAKLESVLVSGLLPELLQLMVADLVPELVSEFVSELALELL